MKKFYTLLVSAVVALAANATDFYLVGGFNGWKNQDPTCLFTAQGDGTYVLDLGVTLTSGFKINDGTWSNNDYNFGGDGVTKLVIGEVYNLSVGGSSKDIAISENIANPHLVFNPEAKTLLITGQSKEAVYCYAVHGEVFDGATWTSGNMDEVDGKWVLTATIVPGSFGLMQMDAESHMQTGWFAGVPVGEEAPAFTLDNLGQPQAVTDLEDVRTNWASNLEGEYTFTFDPEALTLTIIEASGIASVVVDNDAPAVYYNLQGVEVANPVRGIYIQVRGTSVKKVVL
ncbi:MAG: hypothetical protein ACI31C_07780 [Muribaculaceae bacterium]